MIFLKRLFLVGVIFYLCIAKAYADEKINVFVSILPQQYFVQQVGGQLVNVKVMVGPGQNPTTYEPTPQQMAALAKADLYFSIGVPFERAWLDKIKQSNKNLAVIECCKSLTDLHGHSHDHDDDIDPHVWTSPRKVKQIVDLIEKSLVEFDRKNNVTYKASANKFINDLHELDELISSRLSLIQQKNLIVSHPSWGYFARDYGLSQISIEQNGKEIQAKSMIKLIKLAKEKNIKAIYVQRQFNDKSANTISKEIGAVVYELDPLAYNYIDNMNDVINKIVKGLSYE
jgi:zinc transport system substrate-binding protein